MEISEGVGSAPGPGYLQEGQEGAPAEEDRTISAAKVIQKCWRNYSKRVVSLDLFTRAIEIMKVPKWDEKIPCARFGNTYVGLPEGLEVVLKKSIVGRFGDRKGYSYDACDLCEEFELKTLHVPKVRRYEDFLVEERIKFDSCDYFCQVDLYANNRDAFTQTAIDFTRFLAHSVSFDYLNTATCIECAGLWPRYDNLVLYLRDTADGKVGMMGLVDLESFARACPQMPVRATARDLEVAFAFFPLHAEEIIAQIMKDCPYLAEEEGKLRGCASSALKFYEAVYLKHAQLLVKKGVSPADPTKLHIELDGARQKEIEAAVIKKLGAKIQDVGAFSEIFPKILQFVLKDLQEELTHTYAADEKPSHLLEGRLIRDDTGKYVPASTLKSEIVPLIPMLAENGVEQAREIIFMILEEMDKREELIFFRGEGGVAIKY